MMKSQTRGDLRGVILAGGNGTRMYPLGRRYPKTVLPICNKPLIGYQIEHMAKLGIRDIVIVLGRLGSDIVRTIDQWAFSDLRIQYVEQENPQGIAHALSRVEDCVDGPMLVFLADIFFRADNLDRMVSRFCADNLNAVLAVQENADEAEIRKNFSVYTDSSARVTRVREKPDVIHNKRKGCGLYLFDRSIFDAIRRTKRSRLRNEYEITDAIQNLIDGGGKVGAESVVEWDVNVTTPDDVLRCNFLQLRALGHDSLVGEGCSIHPGAAIRRAIIGAGVAIRHPIAVTESVIFSNAIIDGTEPLHRAIVEAC